MSISPGIFLPGRKAPFAIDCSISSATRRHSDIPSTADASSPRPRLPPSLTWTARVTSLSPNDHHEALDRNPVV